MMHFLEYPPEYRTNVDMASLPKQLRNSPKPDAGQWTGSDE